MALVVTGYVDPGVYIQPVVGSGQVNTSANPLVLGLIGPGSRQKRVTNEAVQRGLVSPNETLVFNNFSGTGGVISAVVAGVQTLTPTVSPSFTTLVIDSTVTIRGDTNASNNGVFPIVDRSAGTVISYSNPAGVASGAFAGTWSVTPEAVLGGISAPKRTNRALQNTTVLRDGKPLPVSVLNYRRAYVESALPGNYVLVAGSVDAISIEMDGKVPLTLIFTAGVGATTVRGTQVTVGNSTIAALGATTLAQIVAAINEGLNPADATANTAVTALGYGASYGSAARAITGTGFRISSPTLGPASDVRVSVPFVSTVGGAPNGPHGSAVVVLFGAAGAINRDAPTVLELQRIAFNSLSVYTASYIDLKQTQDATANTGILGVTRIGTSPGTGKFNQLVDFGIAVDNAHIDWSLPSAASTVGTISGTFNLAVQTTIRLGIDGRAPVDIALNGMASPPAGYHAPAAVGTQTTAEVANNINAVLEDTAAYGSRYGSVASVLTSGGSTFLVLTSPTTGTSSAVTIATPTTAPGNDATLIVFGLTSTQLPKTVTGTGQTPAAASIYYVTYDITRVAADYNVQKRFFSETAAQADLGDPNSLNPLMVAAHMAFRQGLSNLVVVQVNDATLPGSPTRNEFLTGLNATASSDLVTDVVALSTDAGIQLDLKDNIETQSSPINKHLRRGWWGMPINTQPGDKDTPGTFVYMAARTLQVAPDSSGRGRMNLVAPPQPQGVSVDLTQSDSSVQRMQLDGTYNAVVAAAKQCTLTNPALSLANATVIGFNLDDINLSTIWSPPQRAVMASQGVLVTTFDANQFKFLDPVTTEGGLGSGASPEFLYASAIAQKDNITRKVTASLTANIVGIVPTDVSDFVIDIKSFIAATVSASVGANELGPFINANGSTRQIDFNRDIGVNQSPNDPTQFFFQYGYNIRLPALRLFGTSTVLGVQNPFALGK